MYDEIINLLNDSFNDSLERNKELMTKSFLQRRDLINQNDDIQIIFKKYLFFKTVCKNLKYFIKNHNDHFYF